MVERSHETQPPLTPSTRRPRILGVLICLSLLSPQVSPAQSLLQDTLTLTVTPAAARHGDRLVLTLSGQPGGLASVTVGDVYLAVVLPDGSAFASDGTNWRLVFDGARLLPESLVPFREDVELGSLSEEVLNTILSDPIPPGSYTFVAFAVHSGTPPLDAAAWLTPLAQAVFTFVGEPSTPAPAVSILANPPSVHIDEATTISWTVLDATSCTATGDWNGPRSPDGGNHTLNVGPSAGSRTYTLSCAGPGGDATSAVVVSVLPRVALPVPGPQCELISYGDRSVRVVNNLNTGVEVDLPQFAFASDMRPGPGVCEIIGLSVFQNAFTVEVNVTQCVNSGQDSRCLSTFGPTRSLRIPLTSGQTQTITIDGTFF